MVITASSKEKDRLAVGVKCDSFETSIAPLKARKRKIKAKVLWVT